MPAFLVRRDIGRTMPDLLACVRGLAGGSGGGERRQQDLDRREERRPQAEEGEASEGRQGDPCYTPAADPAREPTDPEGGAPQRPALCAVTPARG